MKETGQCSCYLLIDMHNDGLTTETTRPGKEATPGQTQYTLDGHDTTITWSENFKRINTKWTPKITPPL